MAWLRSRLEAAGAGDARIGLIGGEPGIGKTRLLREFLLVADNLGWQTVWGHCSSDAGDSHLPFATGLIPQLKRAGLLADEDPVAALRSDDLPMLATSLVQLTVALAARRPLVFVIDDCQFAEASTLRLIGEYGRQLTEHSRRESLKLLLLVTHHPPLGGEQFGVMLERLRREPVAQALALGGLSEVEVHDLIRDAASSNCDPQLLGAIVEATGGNPFSVIETLHYLERRHLLREAGGYLSTTLAPSGLASMPAVFTSLADRLKALDADLLALLQAAAVLGDNFALEDLRAVVATPELEATIDRAIALGLLEEAGARLAFAHGMVRSAATESTGPMQRKRLHTAAANHLLGRDGETPEEVLRLARHVLAAGAWPDPAQAGTFYARAGEAALETFAWATAQRYFEAALAVQPYLQTLAPRELGHLFAKAARANDNNGDLARGRDLHLAAMEHLREAGDLTGWGLQMLGWWRTFTNSGQVAPDDGKYEEFAERVGDGELAVRAQLVTHKAEGLWSQRDPRDREVAEEALALAERSGDAETRAYAATIVGMTHDRHLDPGKAEQAYRSAIADTSSTENPRVRAWGRARIAIPLVLAGRLEDARNACTEQRLASQRGGDPASAGLNAAVFHAAAVLRGDGRLASELRAEGAMLRERIRYPFAGFILNAGTAWVRVLRGEYDEARDALAGWQRDGGRSAARSLGLLLDFRAGATADVRERIDERPLRLAASGMVDFTNVGPIAVAGDLAAELDLQDLAGNVVSLLSPVIRRGVLFSVNPPLLLPRAAATAARAAGHLDLAEEFLDLAQRTVETSGAEGERGLVGLERFRLLRARHAGERLIAAAATDAAGEFSRRDMVGVMSALVAELRESGVPARLLFEAMPADGLAPTEREVVEQLATGLDAAQVAETLLLSPRTVETTLQRLARRLGIVDAASASSHLAQGVHRASETRAPAVRPELAELTRREMEVLGLVARGMTNQQIADELVISLHTAIRHVANILEKTGAANRTEAARLVG